MAGVIAMGQRRGCGDVFRGPFPFSFGLPGWSTAMMRFLGMLLLLAGFMAAALGAPPTITAAASAPAGWSQLILAGGITVNQAIPDVLATTWAKEIAANDRHYRNDLGMNERTDPNLFRQGHAPAGFLYREFRSSNRAVRVSILETALGCDPDKILPADANYDLCPAQVTVTEGGQTRTASLPQVCWYDVSEDTDYSRQPTPNGTFVRIDEAAHRVQFGVWERGKLLPQCTKQISLP
jgi:hypothetical protein